MRFRIKGMLGEGRSREKERKRNQPGKKKPHLKEGGHRGGIGVNSRHASGPGILTPYRLPKT